nr:TIGR03936 family radical SAM-associated protein [Ornithinimicrobium sediminis]
MRFTSTRDFQRALERAVRKAGLPMAFSAGFHPHPRISYANAAPTGAASEAEYVEISLTREVDPDSVGPLLDAALPAGLDVVSVVRSPPGALADALQASVWEMDFRDGDAGAVRAAATGLLATEELRVTRMMKQGPRELDVRAALVGVETAQHGARVEATVRHTIPTIRPEEIWTAMRAVTGADLPRPVSTRLRQGPLTEDGAVLDPPV